MNTLIVETQEKIRSIESELHEIALKLDTERKEANIDEDFIVQTELIDKKEYLEEQLEGLKLSLSKLKTMKGSKSDKIGLGVEAIIDMNGQERNMTLVAPVQADPTKGLISAESPIGQALLGQKVGSKVEINTPSGIKIFNIVDIKNSL